MKKSNMLVVTEFLLLFADVFVFWCCHVCWEMWKRGLYKVEDSERAAGVGVWKCGVLGLWWKKAGKSVIEDGNRTVEFDRGGDDLTVYTHRFQELVFLYTKMVPDEVDRVEKFIGGLPKNIYGNVIVAEPTRLQDAIYFANNLIDQKLKGCAARNAENKRRFDNNPKIMESIKKEAYLMKVQLNGANKYQVSSSLGDQCVVDVGDTTPRNMVTAFWCHCVLVSLRFGVTAFWCHCVLVKDSTAFCLEILCEEKGFSKTAITFDPPSVFQLSQHRNNLETLLNAETLHEKDSKSALSVIKVQFESKDKVGRLNQCKVQEVQSSVTSSEMKQAVGLNPDRRD
ncbi:hypothetical protein Tco_0568685 [Tanacetum coccineum]